MTPNPTTPRQTSLDQFRGYTVLGMFLVNFVGSYPIIKSHLPLLAHHNTYCSYADTIMPQFFFAVGFAFRLTYLKRRETHGTPSALWHALKRNLALLVVALFMHGLDASYPTWQTLQEAGAWHVFTTAFAKSYFQTLTHIAFASLWILPVIGAGQLVRLSYLIFSAGLFHLLSTWGYYEWVTDKPGGIDGGVLGFMSWSIPMLLGSFAYDWTVANKAQSIKKLLAVGGGAMLIGYALSCLNLVTSPNESPANPTFASYLIEPPFIAPTLPKNIWTMSQKAGAISYMFFGGGFAMALYALFVLACDVGRLKLGLFRTLGVNALAGYILHELVNAAIKPFIPKDSPLWWIFVGFAISLLLCYACLRHLEKHKLYLRL